MAPSRMKKTLLLLEFALRGLWAVWSVKATIAWDRQGKTILLTIGDRKEE